MSSKIETVLQGSVIALALICVLAHDASATQQSLSTASLDSLLNAPISAASKYSQSSAEAPASVTIVTSAQIIRFGYRNLEEVLEGVRGFYVSNDRNYPYLGTRGFSRPTDYNNRILVLVDGHTVNEQIWGSASVGSDLPINLSAIERIEIVRGPGSALYGTNAMFAVVNIVLKSGSQLAGGVITLGGGEPGYRDIGIAYGNLLGARGSFALSLLATDSKGNNFYFPELDAPENNNGVSNSLDWEKGHGVMASLNYQFATAKFGLRSRSKGIPTGAYGVLLGDRRAQTTDESIWGEIALEYKLPSYSMSARLFSDRYHYLGTYPYDDGPAYMDEALNEASGAEAMLAWDPASSFRFSLGSEFRSVERAVYLEHYADGSVSSDNNPFNNLSFFAQGEADVTRHIKVSAGLRHDQGPNHSGTIAPRFAVVAMPDDQTTVKALHGTAYRDPSVAESQLSTGYYHPNPEIRRERVATSELEIQRSIGKSLLLTGTVYTYRVRDLIEQVGNENEPSFQNVSSAHASGVELQTDIDLGSVDGQVTYATQHTRAGDGGQMTNSPQHIANAKLFSELTSGLHAAIEIRYESARKTLAQTETKSFFRADANLRYSLSKKPVPQWLRPAGVSVRVSNLFDTPYSLPAGFEHAQQAIVQQRRSASLRLSWNF